MAELISAIDKDVHWLREARRLLEAASEWEVAGRKDDKLFRGVEISNAETWSARRPQSAPPVAELVLEFLVESRAAETARQKRERSRQRLIGGLIGVAMLVTALGLSGVIAGKRQLSSAQSLMLSRVADQFYQQGDYLHGLRLAVLATKENLLAPSTPEALQSLRSNASSALLQAVIHIDKPIKGVTALDDGRRVLVVDHGGIARLWDTRTGAEIGASLRLGSDKSSARSNPIGGVSFSSDQRRLIAWSSDGTARVVDALTGKQIGQTLRHGDAVNGGILLANGQRALTWSDDETARLWNVADGAEIGGAMEQHGAIQGAQLSADERRLATTADDGSMRLWNAGTGAPIGGLVALGEQEGSIETRFSPDSTRLIIWNSYEARLLDGSSSSQIGSPIIVPGAAIDSAEFSRDGRFFLIISKRTVEVRNGATGLLLGRIRNSGGPIVGASFVDNESVRSTWGLSVVIRDASGHVAVWSMEKAGLINAGVRAYDNWPDGFAGGYGGTVVMMEKDRVPGLLTWALGHPKLWDIDLITNDDDAVTEWPKIFCMTMAATQYSPAIKRER